MLNNKVIVITGATSGIGALLARETAKLGAKTIITGRNEERLKQVASELGEHGAYFVMDVNDADQIIQTFHHIVHSYGKVDIIVNNAGYGLFASIEELSLEMYEKMMDTNYMGIVRCTKLVLPYMVEAGSGHIVNIASLAGRIGSAKSTSYTATKHAVLGFTNSLRMELRARKLPIAVSAVNPGPIRTPFFQKADPEGTYANNINWLMMEPEYVVKKIIKLLHTRRSELNLPYMAGFGLKLYGLFPRLIDKLAGGWLNKK
ncbi:SDR family NAD(P)-dependent oxidoreductase [Paenibacillus sp. FSL W7-1287]|uniref:SDR family NAD(P)-dependent oxidoreductase n=1 Tax=Paenibacillus sp. FSL W7-1287 TaxID=2954538 RepID=UPI0030F8512A